MRELSPVAAPVAAIVQQQRADWNQLVGEIARLAMAEDQSALAIGDRLVRIEDEWGKGHVKKAAEQAGLVWTTAKQRAWVARKIPPGHRLRSLSLTFCHLRTIAATSDPESWAEKALEHEWSVATLRGEIERAGDLQARAVGDPCIQCERSLEFSTRIVSFVVEGARRARCCSPVCARDYFTELVAEGPEADPLGGIDG